MERVFRLLTIPLMNDIFYLDFHFNVAEVRLYHYLNIRLPTTVKNNKNQLEAKKAFALINLFYVWSTLE